MGEQLFLTECDVPDRTIRRLYFGCFLHHVIPRIEAGYENAAASWIVMDDSHATTPQPVAGTLRVVIGPMGGRAVEYVDARDVGKMLACTGGDGI